MELYLKAGPDGKEVGDCPFAQFVRCVLQHKNVPYTVKPCTQETKPDWLIRDYGGKMPCLLHNGKGIIESMDIARYIETTFPDKPVPFPDEAVMQKLGGFFPAMAKYAIVDGEDPELEERFLSQCEMLETLLKEHEFLTSSSETMADYSMTPKLYHMTTVIREFHPDTFIKIEKGFPKLVAYMERMFKHPSFIPTLYDRRFIVEAWKVKRSQV